MEFFLLRVGIVLIGVCDVRGFGRDRTGEFFLVLIFSMIFLIFPETGDLWRMWKGCFKESREPRLALTALTFSTPK